MPLTTRLLVAGLALVTLSLNPLDAYAGPLQAATQKVPPEWLTRSEGWPRQTRQMPCLQRILLGLGIGAGVGVGLLAYTSPGVGAKGLVGASLAFGGIGSAMGYKMCR